MQEIVAIAVVAVLALIGLVPALRRVRSVLGFEHFLSVGHVYLVVGIVLGPYGTGLINDTLLVQLGPIITFLLAWMGLIVGLRMELALLRRVGGLGLALTGVEAAAPALLVPFSLVFLPGDAIGMPVLLAAAACAAGTAATAATYLFRGRQANELTFVRVAASLDDWAIVLLAVVAFGAARGLSWEAVGIGALGIGGGVVVGVAVGLLIPRLEQSGEELVVIIGGAALAGGFAVYLGLSAVVAGAFTGVVVANMGRHRGPTRRLYDIVTRAERPLYHAFVVIAGALLGFQQPGLVVPLTVVFFAARGLAKLGAGRLGARLSGQQMDAARMAVAVLPMSPLALAVAVELRLVHPGPGSSALLVAVAVSWLLFEIVASVVAPRLLGRAPE